MATVSKKPQATAPDDRPSSGAGLLPKVLRGFDAVYHFLASLKLAVITLGSLAGVLAYATFFESKYGGRAAQEWIYQSKGFAILLAFLAANILCAALIRYPWKRRQTGFVITHAGLLTLIAGSYYAKVTADEGQFAAMEGETKGEFVRTDFPVIRVQKVDPHSGSVDREWELPFRPGSFAWGPGVPKPTGFLTSALGLGDRNPQEVLTRPDDPFTFVVKSHIPASVPAIRHEAGPGGMPMAKIRAWVKPPRAPQSLELFPDDEDRWFTFDSRLYRVVRGRGPAQVAFAYVDRPEMVDDFLNPPDDQGTEGVARFRYKDKGGKPKTHDWPLDGGPTEAVTLPESDLSVKFLGVLPFEAESAGLGRAFGEPVIPMAEFEVSGPGVAPAKYFAMASLPMVPNRVPTRDGPSADPPLLTLSYHLPPVLDPAANGRFGLIEILGTSDGALFYRVYGRPDPGTKARSKLRSKGKVEKGKEVVAFGGEGMLMRASFAVEDYLTSGVETEVCDPVALPRGQIGNGIAASRVALTVKDASGEQTKEFFVRRSESFEPIWQTVSFPNVAYRVAYDVDRRPLGFDLKLVDFQREFDPGSEQASRFRSEVRLTDKAAGVDDKPVTIAMNEPLTHKGFTFYQSSYIRERDPKTRAETGRVISVLQVGLNPGRTVMYFGCLLVVLGAFAQFYMRAGVFTDGGRRERAKARAKAPANGRSAAVPADEPVPPRGRRDDEETL